MSESAQPASQIVAALLPAVYEAQIAAMLAKEDYHGAASLQALQALATGMESTLQTAASKAPGKRSELCGYHQTGAQMLGMRLNESSQQQFTASVETPCAVGIGSVDQSQA